MNPLVPTSLDGIFMSVLALGFVLAIVAFVSLMMTASVDRTPVVERHFDSLRSLSAGLRET